MLRSKLRWFPNANRRQMTRRQNARSVPATIHHLEDRTMLSGITADLSDASVSEGGDLTFTVTLSGPSTLSTQFDYSTSDGSADASDYTGETEGSLVIPAGMTTGTITVATTADGTVELDETMTLTLDDVDDGGAGVMIGDGVGVGTILNDDSATASIADAVVIEGGDLLFDITLSAPVDVSTQFDFDTTDGTATAGADYTGVSGGSVVILAGGTTGTITISTIDDTDVEPSETLAVTLTGIDPNGRDVTFADATATGTIDDNDAGGNSDPVVETFVGATIDENGTATVTGSFSDADAGDTHTVVVDWGDGVTTTATVDASAMTFTASRQFLDDDPTGTPSDTLTATVTVTDDGGASDTATADVTINNVAPVIDSVTSSAGSLYHASNSGTVTIDGTFTDVGTLDTHEVTVDWGDGTSTTVVADSVTGEFSATYTYTDGGIYDVTATLVDDDTGSDTAAARAVVEGVGLVGGTLFVIGTNGHDEIDLSHAGGQITVDAEFDVSHYPWDVTATFDLNDIDQIVAFLRGGNDHYHGNMGSAVTAPQAVFGGSGHDHLRGGAGNDLLVGGFGGDWIEGRGGNDLLVGHVVDASYDLSLLDAVIADLGDDDPFEVLDDLGYHYDDYAKDYLNGQSGADLLVGTRRDYFRA